VFDGPPPISVARHFPKLRKGSTLPPRSGRRSRRTAGGWGARDARGVEIRIEATNLPGRACGASPNFPGYENIHVGIQRSRQLLGLTPGDAPAATWTLECDVVAKPSGIDFKGPHIQGRPHERFIYLSWGTVDSNGTFNMFRRAKLWLDAVDAEVLDAARTSQRLVARLGLTDAKGHPLCASVRPPLVQWSTG
jgi:hypothetical protein